DDVVLDVGCGVGGPARAMAASVGCTVAGVDLTPSFVDAATTLSALTGHGDDTSFRVGDATALGAADGTYSAATMFHVGMNLPDKTAVFGEVHRVLRPGGRFAVYDIMRTGPGQLSYPLPWSASPATSHLATPDEYVMALTSAGFSVGAPVDHRELVAAALERTAAHPPAVTLVHLMGPDFPTMIGNLAAAFQAGTVTPIRIVATA
ncbi:MAG: class I SAM-dependent methyltransferase, partial [Actinomycetota bacterium]